MYGIQEMSCIYSHVYCIIRNTVVLYRKLNIVSLSNLISLSRISKSKKNNNRVKKNSMFVFLGEILRHLEIIHFSKTLKFLCGTEYLSFDSA